jgi:hypothetical protein
MKMDIPDILTIVAVIFMVICKVCFSMPLSKIAIAFLGLSILLAIVKRL